MSSGMTQAQTFYAEVAPFLWVGVLLLLPVAWALHRLLWRRWPRLAPALEPLAVALLAAGAILAAWVGHHSRHGAEPFLVLSLLVSLGGAWALLVVVRLARRAGPAAR